MEEENQVVIVTNVYGDICIRKARRKRQKLLVKEMLFDYASNTTLHGIPYLAKTGPTLIEKIFWLITFLVSVSMCFFLISKLWIKWQTAPVIVTVSEQLVPVDTVPFPSVTICPQSKCRVSIYNFTHEKMELDAFKKLNSPINDTMKEKIAKYDGISQVCEMSHGFNLSEIYPNQYADSSVVKNILEVAPDYSDVFLACAIHGVYDYCNKIFDKIVTSEGICFNMNSLAANEIFRTSLQRDYKYLYADKPSVGWSVQQGYNYSLKDFYPMPGSENGEYPDVVVALKEDLNERDKLCNGLNSGFKLYVQHSTDLPQSSLYYYAVIKNQVSSMALSFSVLNTSESLRGYDPEIRQCYFPDERYLKYFRLYTANNCRLECLANITFNTCHCVAFYMPHSSSKRICTRNDENCISEARDKMRIQESVRGKPQCHCLPSCNSVDYEAEILKTDFNLKQYIKTMREVHNVTNIDMDGTNFSKLEMYFKKPRFLSMRRSELFGVIDFLANCGGLLGLFLGFSFLSLVEIFYFLSLRLCCTLKKDLEDEKEQTVQEHDKVIHIDKY